MVYRGFVVDRPRHSYTVSLRRRARVVVRCGLRAVCLRAPLANPPRCGIPEICM